MKGVNSNMKDKLIDVIQRIVNREILTNASSLFSHLQECSDTYLIDDTNNLYMDNDELIEYFEQDFKDYVHNLPDTDIKIIKSSFCDECRDNAYDMKEVFQWFIISEWLYDELNIMKEPVCEVEGIYFWGRQGMNYSLEDEHCIIEIAKKLNNYKPKGVK